MPRIRLKRPLTANLDQVMGQSRTPYGVTMRQFIWFGFYDDFVFPYAPKLVDFSNMSGEIAEIQRPRSYATVSQRNLKLTRVQFSFTMADRASGGLLPIDDELRRLRAMAMRDTNVTFQGLDRLIQYNIPTEWFTNVLTVSWWKIADLSIAVKQRTSNNPVFDLNDGSAAGNRISVAECSMSLVEWRNPNIPFQWLPQITYPVEFPGGGGGSGSNGIFNVQGDGKGYAD